MSVSGQIKKTVSLINPTGSYELDSKTELKDGDTYGYFGRIRIKLLTKSKVAISFFVCKGAPGYNSGSFVDTLQYRNNLAIYTTPEDDSACKIIFKFSTKGINVVQYQADINFGCGFGHGVFADGYYKKTTAKTPEIIDLMESYDGTNGILKK